MRPFRLNERQRRFCHEYVKCGIGGEAVKRAGYPANNRQYPYVQANRLMSNDNIREYIDSLLERADNLKKITPETIKLMLLERVTDTNARDADRIRAAELLGKADGMFKEVQVHEEKTDAAAVLQALKDILPDEQLNTVAQALGVDLPGAERH